VSLLVVLADQIALHSISSYYIMVRYKLYIVIVPVTCVQISSMKQIINLFLAKCEDPRDLLPAESNVSVSIIEGYNGFPIESSTVRFSCPSGLELIGPHSAKCTENGEWEPDLTEIRCRHSEIGLLLR
jgi:hypothetical protein